MISLLEETFVDFFSILLAFLWIFLFIDRAEILLQIQFVSG